MKTLIIMALAFVLSSPAFAKKSKVTAPPVKRKLGTNFDFGDMMVRGKYQYPDEALTSVEDEKSLDDLLGVRKHFKDRLSQTATRH